MHTKELEIENFDECNFQQGNLVSVLLVEPLDKCFDYRVAQDGVALGSYVQVPLGSRTVLGVVWGRGEGGYDITKAREISSLLDIPPMEKTMRLFLERAADYTLTPRSSMLRLATRIPRLGFSSDHTYAYKLSTNYSDVLGRMTPARKRVLTLFDNDYNNFFMLQELSSKASCSPSVVKGLVKSGILEQIEISRDRFYPRLDPLVLSKKLNKDQRSASAQLRKTVAAKQYETTVLRGVTGSGKTEVYLEAVAQCLSENRQVLILIPEIALSIEFLDRVKLRFGAYPAQWHSDISHAERRRCWRMVAQNKVQMVIGARSALFLPFVNLGLIVVDEEHDSSYKQEEGVLYSARDMAVLRGAISNSAVVLASATPSLETWENAENGKYKRLDLPKRYGHAILPDMVAIDMREQTMMSNTWISPLLHAEVTMRLSRNEQSLLFINRRGYAPVTVCRKCGGQVACYACDSRMVEHRFNGYLMCHQCGAKRNIPKQCPDCHESGFLTAIGSGVERLAEEAKSKFPNARIAVLSSDMSFTASALKTYISDIAKGEADIIIGTQLVAKGHNFPLLTCVGVIDADLGLHGSDLRAAERSFQLIRQVAGRAGRADRKGVAYIQTFQPEHPVMQAILSGDEDDFWRAEATQRRLALMPPYGRLAGIIISGADLKKVTHCANDLAKQAKLLHDFGIELFGPAPAPIARIRGKTRMRFLAKAPKHIQIQPYLKQWRNSVSCPAGVRIAIDIDPQSFY